MNNIQFNSLLALIDDFTNEQRDIFKKVIDGECDFEKIVMILDSRLLIKKECPFCQSTKVRKWGRQSGIQRMQCVNCRKTYNALTGTPLARLRKKEEWLNMAQALKEGMTIKKTAEKCGASIPTAFRWRHRFLKAMKDDMPTKLEGIAEADETYFLASHKGERHLPRKPRKRGGKASKPGLSSEQIPVLIARDRVGGVVDAVLPDQTTGSIRLVLGERVSRENILCIDGGNALWGFVSQEKIPCKVIPAGKHVHERNPIFHIQNVNGYHSRLKEWMFRFHGVATKYLPNYLGWRRAYELGKATTPTAWMQAAVKPEAQLLT